jgi:glycosyltransferase involved in cell wall biosynthesis
MVSFCIITYNQEAFVREAIEAALRQNYSDIEFLISDDCSTDSTFEVIQSTIRRKQLTAPIKVLKTPVNLGMGGNINRVMEVAKGSIIIIAAGDDISHPDRTLCSVEAFRRYSGHVYSVYSDHRSFTTLKDDDREEYVAKRYEGKNLEYLRGNLADYIRYMRPMVTGATHAWHRNVFEKFGALGPKTRFEDLAISFRSLSLGGVICRIKDPLVLYRRHATNMSFNSLDRIYQTKDELETVKLKELAALRGFLVGYKYMKRDLKLVTGLEEQERRRLVNLLNQTILWYRVQIRLRTNAGGKRARCALKYLRLTRDLRTTPQLIKLLIPECLLDRMRLLKRRLKPR